MIEKMEREEAKQVSDEEALFFAMELSGASAAPMVLKAALELGIIEIIAKAGPNAHLSSSNIASQIPSIKNPDAPSMLDRLLRLLASYKILTCSIQNQDGDSIERLYGLHPLAKYFVNNQDGVSMISSFLMQHDKVLKDMWYDIIYISIYFLLVGTHFFYRVWMLLCLTDQNLSYILKCITLYKLI